MAKIKIALVGNPNCGKTTMFNDLTGSNQYVGNWPGVTVEKKEGALKGSNDVIITDLPGIYSLSPYTLEEVVSRNYLLDDDPAVILNLVDGSNIERNLYLTTQLLEMGLPVVIALNMIDIVRKNGDEINVNKLSEELGCAIVETAALSGLGSKEAALKAKEAADKQERVVIQHNFGLVVEDALTKIERLVGSELEAKSLRWSLVKLFERDREVLKKLSLSADKSEQLEKIIAAVEKELDDDSESIITNARYEYITALMQRCVKKAQHGMTTTDKIDSIVTNRYLALPIFAAVMFLVYFVSVTSLGTIVTDWTNDTLFGETIQPFVQEGLENSGTEPWLVSLIVDGIIGGLAAPLGFAPQMAILFFFLAILEDCGYMARIAFIMDRAFHKFGLSGKSIIPMLISSGCGVPGIMAARTIENEADRRMTITTTTFVPCGAKLPVIALIAGAIMGGDWYMAPLMYFIGIMAVIISCIILKKSETFAGEPAPFVMELPPYHMPAPRNVLIHVWERVWSFLKKAGTVLFLCCVVMWFLATFGVTSTGIAMVDTEESLMAEIGSAIAPLFAPLGFDSWQAVAAAISGFVAKEGIVSTIGVLTGMAEAAEDDTGLWQATMALFPNAAAAFAFLVFNLLDSPCLAAISTMHKEFNNTKWTVAALLYQNVFAYAVTFMFYQFGAVYIGAKDVDNAVLLAGIVFLTMLWLLVRPAAKPKHIKVGAVGTDSL